MRLRNRLTRAVGGLLLPAALLFAGCGENPEGVPISMAQRTEVASVRPPEPAEAAGGASAPLRVAIASILSPSRTLDDYHDLLTYMGQRLGRPIRLYQRGTYAEVNDLLKNREIDLAFVCAGAFVYGERDFGLEALVVPVMRRKTTYYSYLIAGRASPAERLEDLRRKSFAFSDPLSNTARLVPVYQLRLLGETPEQFFSRTVFTYSHDNSILAVAEGLVDGAAVDSLVYDYLAARNPDAVAGTRIVARWGPYGIPPVVVHPALDPAVKRALKRFLLSIHEDPEGRRILGRLLIDRFAEAPRGMFDSIRQMIARVERR